jgi:hypothetical protein
MRKYLLRAAGVLLIVGSLAGIGPTPKAEGQTICACFTLCEVGKHCCPVLVGGKCENFCVPDGQPCPP